MAVRALLYFILFATFPARATISGPRACAALIAAASAAVRENGADRERALTTLYEFIAKARLGEIPTGSLDSSIMGAVSYSGMNTYGHWPVVELRIKDLMRAEKSTVDGTDPFKENHAQLVSLKGRDEVQPFMAMLKDATHSQVNSDVLHQGIVRYLLHQAHFIVSGIATAIFGTYLAIGQPEMTTPHLAGGALIALSLATSFLKKRDASTGYEMVRTGSPLQNFLRYAERDTWAMLSTDIFVSKRFLRQIFQGMGDGARLREEEILQLSWGNRIAAHTAIGEESDMMLFRFDLLHMQNEGQPEVVLGIRSLVRQAPATP